LAQVADGATGGDDSSGSGSAVATVVPLQPSITPVALSESNMEIDLEVHEQLPMIIEEENRGIKRQSSGNACDRPSKQLAALIVQLDFNGSSQLRANMPPILHLQLVPGRDAVVGRTVCGLKATPKLLGVGMDNFQLVSRRHALVRIGTTGTTICRDEHAVNGLWVDGRKIGKGQSTTLTQGCKVAFGHKLIEYKVHLP
jgi:hypothetical protein